MRITDKTRKILWGKAGGFCSRCKSKLFEGDNNSTQETVKGEECHIIAQSPNGPRGDKSYQKNKLDLYENLILLCRNCHVIIDKKTDVYTIEKLLNIKKEHEDWIKMIGNKKNGNSISDFEILKDFYQCFDRYAFKQPMQYEESISFIQAIRDTRIAFTTGIIRMADKTIITQSAGKSQLHSQNYRKKFDIIVDKLKQIEEIWDNYFLNNKLEVRGNGCICYESVFLNKIDELRNEIINQANKVFTEIGKRPLRNIPKVEKRKRGYTTGYLSVEKEFYVDPDNDGSSLFGKLNLDFWADRNDE